LNELSKICAAYLSRLSNSAATFRYAYQIGIDLNAADFRGKLLVALRGAPEDFKIQVKESYKFGEPIPGPVLRLLP
jgi:hypothetical protein